MFLFLLNTALLLGPSKGALEHDMEELMNRLKDMESSMSNMKEKLNDYAEKLEGEDPEIEARLTKLEDLAKIGTLRSCFEYSQYGLKSSGSYMIDPDGGLIGQEPFQVLRSVKKITFKIQVYCNFTTGATEVLHDTEVLTEVEHCHDPGERTLISCWS